MTLRQFYPPDAEVNALTICNACGVRRMLPSEEGPDSHGYCQECCEEDAANLNDFEVTL